MEPQKVEKMSSNESEDRQREQIHSSCCQSKPKGVVNSGYVEVDVENVKVDEEEVRVTRYPPPLHIKKYRKKHHQEIEEEIGLKGLQYKPLCHCEEVPGRQCACRTITATVSVSSTPPNVRFEVWGRWKCVALSLTVALTCVWLVVYISLHYTNVI